MKEATRTQVKNNLGEVMRAAFISPVIVTDRGKESHVLMTIERYRELLESEGKQKSS